jgi:hypothetical protein
MCIGGNMPKPVGIGSPAEQKRFIDRHASFFEQWPELLWCVEHAFLRDIVSTSDVDPLIFYLGRRCFDDFQEIMELAANAHGYGATTLLRSMYERAVTAAYLHRNPDEAALFRDYSAIQSEKLLSAIARVLGDASVPAEALANARAECAVVRDKYLVAHCDHCAKTRVNHTWSKLTFVEIAKRSGELAKLIIHAYYVPLEQSHSTLRSAINRLRMSDDGDMLFEDEPNRSVADDAFATAQLILLHVLDLQREHFHLDDMREKLELCSSGFNEGRATDKAGA